MENFMSLGQAMKEIMRARGISPQSQPYDEAAYLQRQADKENETVGTLTGYDCPLCKNRGHTAKVQGREVVLVMCECRKIRATLRHIRQSGLESVMNTHTFERFVVNDQWQEKMISLAKRYVEESQEEWLFMGGQVGCGKTHLCTAAAGSFLKQGKSVRYMMWLDDSAKLKAMITDSEEYSKRVNDLKTAGVLYIDDFFKTQNGKNPSPADVRLAFEILNFRYAKKLRTIISSERSMNELLDIDEALGSRIYSMTSEFCFQIGKDPSKNFRMKGGKTEK